jgi:hypothetical protein
MSRSRRVRSRYHYRPVPAARGGGYYVLRGDPIRQGIGRVWVDVFGRWHHNMRCQVLVVGVVCRGYGTREDAARALDEARDDAIARLKTSAKLKAPVERRWFAELVNKGDPIDVDELAALVEDAVERLAGVVPDTWDWGVVDDETILVTGVSP